MGIYSGSPRIVFKFQNPVCRTWNAPADHRKEQLWPFKHPRIKLDCSFSPCSLWQVVWPEKRREALELNNKGK